MQLKLVAQVALRSGAHTCSNLECMVSSSQISWSLSNVENQDRWLEPHGETDTERTAASEMAPRRKNQTRSTHITSLLLHVAPTAENEGHSTDVYRQWRWTSSASRPPQSARELRLRPQDVIAASPDHARASDCGTAGGLAQAGSVLSQDQPGLDHSLLLTHGHGRSRVQPCRLSTKTHLVIPIITSAGCRCLLADFSI